MELLKMINNASHANTGSDTEISKVLDHIASIEHSCQRLNLDYKEESLFSNDDYLNYFLTIDDKTRLIVEKITESYLKVDVINQQYKSRMANAVFLHHRTMFSIYFKLIVTLGPSKHDQLGTVIGRALNNATEIIKWRYFNYQGAPGNIWLQISNLFDLAEKNNLLNEKVTLYPELEHAKYIPDTIAASFIKINMLGSLESLSFKPQQVDFLSKILGAWTRDIPVENTYDAKRHLFSTDLAKNAPAKRIRNIKESITSRFWCMDTINVKIQIFMNCIQTDRDPKQPLMKALKNNIYAYQSLQMIRAEWSLSEYKRQRRSSPRVKTDKVATNAFGFEDTYYQIKHYEHAITEIKHKSFSEPDLEDDSNASIAAQKLKQHAESMTAFVNVNHGFCNIVDESINGLCIHVEKKPHELSIGMMLGIAVNGNRFGTKIGIIRSIRTMENKTLRIGVEIIARNAFSISASFDKDAEAQEAKKVMAFKSNRGEQETVESLINEHQFGDETEVFNCLFLPKEFSFTEEPSLILPKHKYVQGGQYKMTVSKDEKSIQINKTLEQHENWIRVCFDEVQQGITETETEH